MEVDPGQWRREVRGESGGREEGGEGERKRERGTYSGGEKVQWGGNTWQHI